MRKKPIKSDLARVDRMTDAEIDYSDIPPLDEAFFRTATLVSWPPGKRQVTVRLDADVLAWLKASGKGYQTRLNYILRAAMAYQAPRAKPRARSPRRVAAGRRSGI